MSTARLDLLLVKRGLAGSRERAKQLIQSGAVFVDGRCADKPGAVYDETVALDLRGEMMPFVSRGGLKLEKALSVFGIDPSGLVCLDCGASTGGFTDCLLQHGAEKVYAVDVGFGQLAEKLRQDPRVLSLEKTNVRYLTRKEIPEVPDLVTVDVSFISLRMVLPALYALTEPGSRLICLIKPQFEAGRENVGKKGVVRDRNVHAQVLTAFCRYAEETGFSVQDMTFSPVRGPEGNIEYLGYLQRDGVSRTEIDVRKLAESSHLELDT